MKEQPSDITGRQRSRDDEPDRAAGADRRGFLRAALGIAAAGVMAPATLVDAATRRLHHGSPFYLPPFNGGVAPFPIPQLDKNGNHNQPAGPLTEPSHIYHFKGRVARCAGFHGMGTDNHGNRIPFGSATTDFGLMQGTYWAARKGREGVFTHI